MKNQTYISYLNSLKKHHGVSQVKVVQAYKLEKLTAVVTYKEINYIFSFSAHGSRLISSSSPTRVEIHIYGNILYKAPLKETTIRKTVDVLETHHKYLALQRRG